MAESVSVSKRRRILLGVTGSVAAVKAPELVCRLLEDDERSQVKILLTAGGCNFWEKSAAYDKESWEKLQNYLDEPNTRVQVIYAEDEWKSWERLGDPVEHIELREWADVLVLAPLSAHTLAKIANGLCDDTLSCVARAWDFGHYDSDSSAGKPVVLAPAMNTAMWEHPLTQRQLDTIQSFWKTYPGRIDNQCGVIVVPPQSKLLACGEMGMGALASIDEIMQAVRDATVKVGC